MTPPKKELTAAQRARLDRVDAKLRKAEGDLRRVKAEWAAVVGELPVSAAARHLGMSRQAVTERLKAAKLRKRLRRD